jgi:hypothetical protein
MPPREGRDVEPNPKMVFGGTIPKMEVLGEWCLTNTDLVLDPRQAPEHYKTPYFSNQILYTCYVYCCITYKSWVKTLLHYIIPCPDI